jgi:hypothetical protein
MIPGIDTIAGGLVALTRFSGDIAFESDGLRRIINIVRSSTARSQKSEIRRQSFVSSTDGGHTSYDEINLAPCFYRVEDVLHKINKRKGRLLWQLFH